MRVTVQSAMKACNCDAYPSPFALTNVPSPRSCTLDAQVHVDAAEDVLCGAFAVLPIVYLHTLAVCASVVSAWALASAWQPSRSRSSGPSCAATSAARPAGGRTAARGSA